MNRCVRAFLLSLLGLFTLAGAAAVSIVTSYCSGFITLQIDDSDVEAVGIIRRMGFPVWYCEQAPGIGMGGLKLDRFVLNSAVWFVFFALIVVTLVWKTRPSRDGGR
jgi:hypothetical protein